MMMASVGSSQCVRAPHCRGGLLPKMDILLDERVLLGTRQVLTVAVSEGPHTLFFWQQLQLA